MENLRHISSGLTTKREREIAPRRRRESAPASAFPERPQITFLEVTALVFATIAMAIALAVLVSESRREEFSAAVITLSETAKIVVDDRALEDQIRQKLAQTPELAGASLTANINAGQVTLRGQVTHPAMKALAEELVKQVQGVTKIVNEITLA